MKISNSKQNQFFLQNTNTPTKCHQDQVKCFNEQAEKYVISILVSQWWALGQTAYYQLVFKAEKAGVQIKSCTKHN